jgi:hypothetical protein
VLHTLRRATVTGVFLSSKPIWGTAQTGNWTHFAATPPESFLFKRLTQTAEQAMAEKGEDYKTVLRALTEFTPEMLQTAVTLLKTDSLYRSEKVLGAAEWLLALHQQHTIFKGSRRDNVTWLAVATAPAGFCHPRSSMIGTLLEDIAAGLDYETVSTRFAAKMHPLRYQRPQAAPSAGTIAQAEKIIEQLNAANALNRRFAKLADIQPIWKPTPQPQVRIEQGGVFGHLLPKEKKQSAQLITPPAITITWEKFQRTVLPVARSMAFFVPSGNDNYAALVTATDPNAPNIFQWDNPVSSYLYHGGSSAAAWNLTANRFHPVTAITLPPWMWTNPHMTHQGMNVLFILAGARDTRAATAGAAIFPETLRSEFHGIRATIEAYSRNAVIADAETSEACGILLSKGGNWKARFKVESHDLSIVEYVLDRWD